MAQTKDIKITIDEKACRGCKLCVDICPTDVYEFDEKEKKCKVKIAADCIECMSCQYICPSNCITQEGLYYSKNFFRNEDVYGRVGRYLFPLQDSMELSKEDYTLAAKDIRTRLSALGATFKKMVGASAPTVATTAGRAGAWHLPEMYDEKAGSLSSLLDDLKSRLKFGWDMNTEMKGDNEATLIITACPVREICQLEGLTIGGDLCDLFRSYLTGIVVEILKKRPMIKFESTGPDQCRYAIKLMEM